MNADEKAVAELFPCYEPNDIGECSPGGDHFKDCPANAAFRRRATALAARIRAEASGEVAAALAASRAEVERLREALEEIIKAWDHKTGDYYVDNYLSDVEIDAARAALAAQGGGT